MASKPAAQRLPKSLQLYILHLALYRIHNVGGVKESITSLLNLSLVCKEWRSSTRHQEGQFCIIASFLRSPAGPRGRSIKKFDSGPINLMLDDMEETFDAYILPITGLRLFVDCVDGRKRSDRDESQISSTLRRITKQFSEIRLLELRIENGDDVDLAIQFSCAFSDQLDGTNRRIARNLFPVADCVDDCVDHSLDYLATLLIRSASTSSNRITVFTLYAGLLAVRFNAFSARSLQYHYTSLGVYHPFGQDPDSRTRHSRSTRFFDCRRRRLSQLLRFLPLSSLYRFQLRLDSLSHRTHQTQSLWDQEPLPRSRLLHCQRSGSNDIIERSRT